VPRPAPPRADCPTGVDVRAFRRQRIGFIFQQHNLIPFLTAVENVSLILHLNGVGKREAHRRAQELLDHLEIDHRARCRRSSRAASSSGWRSAARWPTSAADPGRRTDRGTGHRARHQGDGAALRRIARERRSAVITVTHDHRMIEGCGTICHLEDGVLVGVRRHAQDTPAPPRSRLPHRDAGTRAESRAATWGSVAHRHARRLALHRLRCLLRHLPRAVLLGRGPEPLPAALTRPLGRWYACMAGTGLTPAGEPITTIGPAVPPPGGAEEPSMTSKTAALPEARAAGGSATAPRPPVARASG
jgi:hypothetical protein